MPAARRHRGVDPLDQGILGHRARGSRNLAAFFDKNEAGNAANGEAGGQ